MPGGKSSRYFPSIGILDALRYSHNPEVSLSSLIVVDTVRPLLPPFMVIETGCMCISLHSYRRPSRFNRGEVAWHLAVLQSLFDFAAKTIIIMSIFPYGSPYLPYHRTYYSNKIKGDSRRLFETNQLSSLTTELSDVSLV